MQDTYVYRIQITEALPYYHVYKTRLLSASYKWTYVVILRLINEGVLNAGVVLLTGEYGI